MIAGHLVPRMAPRALRDLTRQLPLGSAVVSGTNGKTTTTRLIAHILRQAGHHPVHNRAGANLLTGLFSAVVQDASFFGRPRSDVGLFEVDEATLPGALRHIEPRVLLLLNIFRDQLDRYGEVHFVAGIWQEAVARLGAATTLAVNADDPLVYGLVDHARGPRLLTYGVVDRSAGSPTLPHAVDARLCPRCGSAMAYDLAFYGHLGWFRCTAGDFTRPTPDVAVTRVDPQGDAGSLLTFRTPRGGFTAEFKLPGLYNVYNALAATAACLALGVAPATIGRGLETFTAAFGRLERIPIERRELYLALVKNPVGFTEVLRTILQQPGRRTLLLVINDQFADGTDISWLWDVDFESLADDRVNLAVCSGIRAEDMSVRLKYAGVPTERIRVENDVRAALEIALQAAEEGETVYALPTYTAMLAVRDVLRQTGYVRGFWED